MKWSFAGRAKGQVVKRVKGNGSLHKPKSRYQICCFLFSSNFDLKNSRKPFWIFCVDK